MSHVIKIKLSKDAQRQAIIDNQPGTLVQTYDVPQELLPRLLRLPWTKVDDAGNATCEVWNSYFSSADVDGDGPIDVMSSGRYGTVDFEAGVRPADAAAAIDQAEAFIRHYTDEILRMRAERLAERVEREAKGRASAAKWAALPLEWRVDGHAVADCIPSGRSPESAGPLAANGSHVYSQDDLRAYAPEAYAEAVALVQQRRVDFDAALAARQQAETASRNAWIAAHGSARLRACLAEKIKHDAIYRDERLAAEAPGWVYYGEIPETADDARNPPAEAFDLLARARAQFKGARLRWLKETRQYVAIADCPWDASRDLVTCERFPESADDDKPDED